MLTETDFAAALQQVETIVRAMGVSIEYTHSLDRFFKGDLDGKNIFISDSLPAEEKLFNLLHLAGHTIEWNVSERSRTIGSTLYTNPDDALLKELQAYEWEANCYAQGLLHKAGVDTLDKWLYDKYVLDMFYLTNYYQTGEKQKIITPLARAHEFSRELLSKQAPVFTPRASERTRKGIVIDF